MIADLRFSISRRIIGPRNDRSRGVRNSSAIEKSRCYGVLLSAFGMRPASCISRGVARVREQGLHRKI
jgi:hypothetical protein